MHQLNLIMKRAAILLFFLPFLSIAQNQDEGEPPWSYNGFFSQQLNQVSFSNWASGGENSFASSSVINFEANYKKEKISAENKLEMVYGIIKNEGQSMRKNQDRLEWISKTGREVSPRLNVTTLINFKTQFYKGYNYPNEEDVISRFMAPAMLLTSLGMDYRPTEYLSVFFSPATGKFTFVLDDALSEQGAYGVDPGKRINPEFGAMISVGFDKKILEDGIRINSRLDLFNNYTDSDVSNRKNTDVNWQTNVQIKINRYITASAMFHMVYDHDIPVPIYETIDGERVQTGTGPRLQLQQVFGLGLSYSF